MLCFQGSMVWDSLAAATVHSWVSGQDGKHRMLILPMISHWQWRHLLPPLKALLPVWLQRSPHLDTYTDKTAVEETTICWSVQVSHQTVTQWSNSPLCFERDSNRCFVRALATAHEMVPSSGITSLWSFPHCNSIPPLTHELRSTHESGLVLLDWAIRFWRPHSRPGHLWTPYSWWKDLCSMGSTRWVPALVGLYCRS